MRNALIRERKRNQGGGQGDCQSEDRYRQCKAECVQVRTDLENVALCGQTWDGSSLWEQETLYVDKGEGHVYQDVQSWITTSRQGTFICKRGLRKSMVVHAGGITMRCEMNDDGQTAYDRIKNERFDNKMLPSREKVVLMMSMDNQGRNRPESLLASIVPRTGEFAVQTFICSGGAHHHRLSAEGRKCDTESWDRVEKNRRRSSIRCRSRGR